MDNITFHSNALAALGNQARLAVFRLLVRAGDEGLRVGEIASHLRLKPSTLAHHLSVLVQARLVIQDKIGREVYSRVDYEVMKGLVEFLTEECCRGVTRYSEEDVA